MRALRYLNMGPWPVFVGITACEKTFQAEMKRLKIENIQFLGHSNAGATTHSFVNHSSLCCIIAIVPFSPQQNSKEQYAALLAHEAMHVIQEMRNELAGGKYLGDEAEAYLMQQIVQDGLQFLWKSSKVSRTEPK